MTLSKGSRSAVAQWFAVRGILAGSARVCRSVRLVWALVVFSVLAGNAGGRASHNSAPGDATAALAEMSIEQLVNVEVDSVYGASRYEQKVTQAPSSVSIVTSADIKRFGHRTLADVLNSVRGLYVSSDRNYSYLGVRGFLRPGDYNTKVLLLVDGHPMNDGVYDSAYYGHASVVDVDMIDRVEVIRGPSSSIYGSSAFFGVINVVTRQGAQVNGGEISASTGSWDGYSGRFSYGRKVNADLQFLISGSVYSSEGADHLYYREFDPRVSNERRAANSGFADGLDGEEALHLNGSVTWRDFTFAAFYTDRSKDVPTASYDTLFDDGREETRDSTAFVDLKWDHSLADNYQLSGRVAYDSYRYSGAYPFDYAEPGDPPDLTINKDHTVADRFTTEWQFTGKFYDRHTATAGVSYRENFRQFQDNYDDVTPRYYYTRDDRSSRDLGVYAELELGLRTNLVLNVGLRHDQYFENFGGTLNPRLGLIYNPWAGGAFKALYGQAFRAPTAYERFYYAEQTSFPELEPETIRTYELVYEQYFRQRYSFGLSGYHYQVENLISETDTDQPGQFYFANLDKVNAWGIEAEIAAKYEWGLSARASYAFQEAVDRNTHEHLTSSPQHLAKLNASYPLYRDKVFAGLELQYVSPMRTLLGQETDGFLLGNFTLLGQRLYKGLEVSASVYNVFDVHAGYPGAPEHLQDVIEQDGRSFRLKLTYRF